MYNEMIKKQYLEESKDRNLSLSIVGTRLFNKIEEMEIELDKDCCNFTISEILIYYKRRFSTSMNSLSTINSLLRGYTNWCLSRNMVNDNQNHYNEVNSELLMSCLNAGVVMDKIIPRKDLLYHLDDLSNISDRALLLALFEGICGENMSDLVYLNCDDLSEDNVFTLHSGRKIKISNELADLCRRSQDIYFYTLSSGYDADLKLGDTGVFKNIDRQNNNGVSRKTLYNKLVRAKKLLGYNYLTTNSLLESGRIEMMREKINNGMTIEEALLDDEVCERYGRVHGLLQWRVKYEDYL